MTYGKMGSLLDLMDDNTPVKGGLFMRHGVPETPEVHRVFSLPRRQPLAPDVIERVSAVFRAPGGQQALFSQQAEAVYTLALTGAFGPIPVGQGKTLISALVAETIGLPGNDVLLLVPGGLVSKTEVEMDAYSLNWRIRRPRILGYEKLGRKTVDLFDIAPKAIIADEAHYLKNLRSSRTRQVARYMAAHPKTVFLPMSGTMTSKSLLDYWHLALWALRERAPVPQTLAEAERWARAVDVKLADPSLRLAPGALSVFVPSYTDFVSKSQGVVPGTPTDIAASISLDFDTVRPSAAPKAALARLNALGERPDGDILTPEQSVSCKFQLELGFFYKEKGEAPEGWRKARSNWNSLVRSLIDAGVCDTELEARNKYGTTTSEGQAWLAIKDSFKSVPEPVWLDETILPTLIERAGPDTLVWTWHSTALEDLVRREVLPVPYFGEMGLDKSGRYIEQHRGACVASIQSNRTGRNLQRSWSSNYLTYPPASYDYWEQLMGRTHRTGQDADTVSFVLYAPSASYFLRLDRAKEYAREAAPLTSTKPKLLLADEGQRK
jgi:hypothetical protein